ncbi:MAG: sigma-70 family RNA polymerase sigma factor [Elusimicrobia bacterium]|nr:sigma-70 family RNA polymerase sigma factor [Elusimicrobiota bacterium]
MSPEAKARAERDQQAIARLLAGDPAAFAELVERHKDAVRVFAGSFACAAEDADDLAQEVFVEVHRSLPRFRGEAAFGTWLYSVARNVCLHRLRARRTLRRRPLEKETLEWLDIPDGRPSPEASAETEESRALVREALETLPPGQRAVLVLSHWEGLPYAEIARALAIPMGTVKSRAHNAVVALAERLQPLFRPAREP